MDLPSVDIGVVHRSDGSGTTYIWTDYLSATDKDWADKEHGGPGATKQLKVDGGEGMAGNPAASRPSRAPAPSVISN